MLMKKEVNGLSPPGVELYRDAFYYQIHFFRASLTKTSCISPSFPQRFFYFNHIFPRTLIGFMVFMLLINSEE
ncbi:hypothetical protein NUBL21980_38140 [Klebsiella michiganensis]|nr:hypothetical protein NUBL21980_38140 [Klebsiella michiganensis]